MKKVLHLTFLVMIWCVSFVYADTCFNINSSQWLQEEKNLRKSAAYDLVYNQNTANVPPSSVSDSQVCFPSVVNGTALTHDSLRLKVNEIIIATEPTPEKIKSDLDRRSKEYLTDNTPPSKAMRNAFRVVMSSLIETRAKVNEVINKGNIPASTLPNRTWAQVVGATKAQIEAETDPNS